MRRRAGGLVVGLTALVGSLGACGHDAFVAGRACAAGETRACYSGPAGTENVGMCVAGVATCLENETGWSACEGEVVPGPETCATPTDDDCDGATNEEGDDCACVAGSQEPCYDGPAGTEGVGACAAGTRTCAPSGAWGVCAAQVVPTEEDCDDPADEDCDGAACAAPRWAHLFGNADVQLAGAVAVDEEGHTFVVGSFYGAIDFGAGALFSAGSSDVFVAKLDGGGKTLWAQRFGGANAEEATSVAVGPDGDVVIAGFFESASLELADVTLYNAAERDAFVAKLDSEAGDVVWAWGIGEGGDQKATAVAIDDAGSSYVVGSFTGDVQCTLFPPSCVTSAGARDGFVARLTAAGAIEWILPFGAAADDEVSAVAIDPQGNALVAGSFAGTAAWGNKVLQTSGNADTNLFVAKLDPAGAAIWARGYGDAKLQRATSIAVDDDGNSVIAGTTKGAISFGANGPTIGDGGERALIAQISAGGSAVWAHAFGLDAGSSSGVAVNVGEDREVALAGSFSGAIDFGLGRRTAVGSFDAFLVRFDAKGAPRWAKTFGSPDVACSGLAVAFTPASDVVFAAAVQGTIDFGLGEMTSAGALDVGVAAFSP